MTTRQSQIDIIDALRLLQATASEEARPILRAAIQEIRHLRERLAELTQTHQDQSHDHK